MLELTRTPHLYNPLVVFIRYRLSSHLHTPLYPCIIHPFIERAEINIRACYIFSLFSAALLVCWNTRPKCLKFACCAAALVLDLIHVQLRIKPLAACVAKTNLRGDRRTCKHVGSYYRFLRSKRNQMAGTVLFHANIVSGLQLSIPCVLELIAIQQKLHTIDSVLAYMLSIK